MNLFVQVVTRGSQTDRILRLDQNSIALAYSEPNDRGVVIGWAVKPGTSASDVLELWYSAFVPHYQPRTGSPGVEFWLEGTFYQRKLQGPPLPSPTEWARSILSTVAQARISPRDLLSLLFLNFGDAILELTFDVKSEDVVQVGCVIERVPLKAIVPFFGQLHASQYVRSDREIAIQAFSDDTTSIPGALGFLSPLPVIQ